MASTKSFKELSTKRFNELVNKVDDLAKKLRRLSDISDLSEESLLQECKATKFDHTKNQVTNSYSDYGNTKFISCNIYLCS